MRLLGSGDCERGHSSAGVGARAIIRRSLWLTLLGSRRPMRDFQFEIRGEGRDGAPRKFGVASASFVDAVRGMVRRSLWLSLLGIERQDRLAHLRISR
jgi:hypothetical protein